MDKPTEKLPEPEKKQGAPAFSAEWLSENAPQITNAGLTVFTGTMLHSGYRGKVISKDIYDAQMGILREHKGYSPQQALDALEAGVKERRIIQPGWHKMRLAYLSTAIVSFAFGAFFKRKEETPEELEANRNLSLPEYMRTRVQQALDPVNHSRQTVGLLSSASGVLAVLSALSQPGGIHKSELYVGSTLALGGAALGFINDPKAAQNTFSTLWLLRLPAILTGTHESLNLHPGYKNPFVNEIKKTPEFIADIGEAYKSGMKHVRDAAGNITGTAPVVETYTFFGLVPRKFLGMKDKPLFGTDAVKKLNQTAGGLTLDYKRMDIAYPIGQWGNLFSAAIGYAAKGAKKPEPAQKPANENAEQRTVAANDAAPVAKIEGGSVASSERISAHEAPEKLRA